MREAYNTGKTNRNEKSRNKKKNKTIIIMGLQRRSNLSVYVVPRKENQKKYDLMMCT